MRRVLLTGCLLMLAAHTFILASDRQIEDEFYLDSDNIRRWVSQALEENPRLLERWAEYRAALQRVPQARALPDPMFSFTQAIRAVETRVGPQYNTFAIAQRLPWFGKLDYQGQIAASAAVRAYHRHASSEREIVAELKREYYRLLFNAVAAQLLAEERAMLERFEQMARDRYAAGTGPQFPVVRLQGELVRVRTRGTRLKEARQLILARLEQLTGSPLQGPVSALAPDALPDLPSLALEELTALSQTHRPELLEVGMAVQQQEQEVELAKREGWPDFDLRFGFTNVGNRNDPAGLLLPPPDNGKNALSLTIGVNLPLWRDKYQSRVLEATEKVIAEKKRYRAVTDEINARVKMALIQLESIQEQVQQYRDLLVPQTRQGLKIVEVAYETGQASVVELLDGERTLFELQLTEVRLREQFFLGLVDLELQLGTKFPR